MDIYIGLVVIGSIAFILGILLNWGRFTLVGYDESQDTAGALLEHAALVDQSVSTGGDDITVPSWASRLWAVLISGADAVRGRITAPSLRKESYVDISRVDAEALPTGIPAMEKFWNHPRQLKAGEGLRALAAEDGVGAQRQIIGVWLGDEMEEVPDGPVETIRFTGTTTLVANAWTLCPLTPDQQLRAGRYAIIGARIQSATGVFGRLVIPGETHRPGCPVYRDEDDMGHQEFRQGGLGIWGEFDHQNIPQVEIVATAGDTAEQVYLDIIQISEE